MYLDRLLDGFCISSKQADNSQALITRTAQTASQMKLQISRKDPYMGTGTSVTTVTILIPSVIEPSAFRYEKLSSLNFVDVII